MLSEIQKTFILYFHIKSLTICRFEFLNQTDKNRVKYIVHDVYKYQYVCRIIAVESYYILE